MLAQVLRPLRCAGSRLIATPTCTKSTLDNDHPHAFALSEPDILSFEPSSAGPSASSESQGPLRSFASRALQAAVDSTSGGESEKRVFSDAGILGCESPSSIAFGDFGSDSAISSATVWPSAFHGAGGQNSVCSWTGMGLYQAPVAPYYQAVGGTQVQSSPLPDGIVMMQPVLMPVLCPFWSMAVQHAASNDADADLGMTSLAERSQPTLPEQNREEEPLLTSQGAIEGGARRSRRSRRGGVAMRKKLALAAEHRDEVDKASLAAQSSFDKLDRASPTEATRQPLKWADMIDEDEDVSSIGSKALASVEEGVLVQATSPSASTGSRSNTEDDVSGSVVDPILLELEAADETSRQHALDWVQASFWPLALTRRGCRIVQKAIAVGTPAYQSQLVEQLHGRVQEVIQSPHANHVLQKFIESMPPERSQFVLAELMGHARSVARHRFGCRILQRLIEHCPPDQTEQLIQEILVDAEPLSRHQYGNFVIQHVLQHGSAAHRVTIADALDNDLIRFSKHRIASHVVSCALAHCASEDVQRLTQTVLNDVGMLSDLSRREYGSFVVREMNRAVRSLEAQ